MRCASVLGVRRKERPEDALCDLLTFIECKRELPPVDCVKACAHHCLTCGDLLQEGVRMSGKKGGGFLDRARIVHMYGCQVEKVPRCREIPSVPHLLGDDLTRTLEDDGPVEESDGFERVLKEWVGHHEVDLAISKVELDVPCALVVGGCHALRGVADAWVEESENLLVCKEYIDIFAVSVVHAQHEDGTATERPLNWLADAPLSVVDQFECSPEK